MANQTHIVKRGFEHSEPYDDHKLYASIYAACLSVRTPAGEAELTAQKICEDIAPWLAKKSEITADDIRRKASEHLNIYNPDAAYMYQRHRMVG